MEKVKSCKDLLMVLLYARGHTGHLCEPIVGKTRLVKMVFLFKKEVIRKYNLDVPIAESAIPDFEAYSFGPFSGKVYEDLEFLVDMGLVDVAGSDEEELLEDEKREYEYWQAKGGSEDHPFQERFFLTDLGIQFVDSRLKGSLSTEQWRVIDDFKKRCTSAPLRALLKYVYSRYPEMTKKSTIRDEVLGR